MRGLGFFVAVVLGVLSIWLISTGSTQKVLRIGSLAGFWALLIGFYLSRLGREPAPAPEPAATAPEPAATAPEPPGQELDVRRVGEIERAAAAAARLEFQAELQELLRRETGAAVAQEVGALRAEVAALRSELLETVGGQLRLERIETTRLIGSDLEALQNELRRLREIGGQVVDTDTQTTIGMAKIVDAMPRTPAPDVADVHDAEIVPDQPALEPEPEMFAGLPRLTRFTDVEPDPGPAAPRQRPTRSERHAAASDRPGRHASVEEGGGGRRHRADGDGNDVLARILARERG